MEEYPQTTLTQKRNQIVSGAKKLKRERLDHEPASDVDKNAIIKVGIWIIAVVFIGVAIALLLNNVLSNKPAPSSSVSPLPNSLPVSSAVTPKATLLPSPSASAVANPTPTVSATPTATPLASSNLAEYSSESRVLSTSNTQNNLILNKFQFFQGASEFNYIFKEVKTTAGQIDSGMSLTYDGNNLTFEIRNVYRDNVTGNGGTTSRTFTGVTGITGTETSNKNNVSKYTFKMTKAYQSKVVVDKEAGTITLQIKNR